MPETVGRGKESLRFTPIGKEEGEFGNMDWWSDTIYENFEINIFILPPSFTLTIPLCSI